MWLNWCLLGVRYAQFWSLWQCRNCGYHGVLILEDGNLATKLQEEWKKGRRAERLARSTREFLVFIYFCFARYFRLNGLMAIPGFKSA